MTEPKKLTAQELLAAPMDSLTDEQLSRRSQIIVLMKQERELEVVNEQNRKFSEEKEQRLRQIAVNLENITREQEDNKRIRKMCKHNTGGKDRSGFFSGDGDIYGRCVSKQQLPTGEIYGLCFRCQKEWHDPKWHATLADGSEVFDGRRAVMDGKMSYALFRHQEKEYREMLGWNCKTFEGNAGELPGGAMFLVPKIQRQLQKSHEEFAAWLAKQPANELVLAELQEA